MKQLEQVFVTEEINASENASEMLDRFSQLEARALRQRKVPLLLVNYNETKIAVLHFTNLAVLLNEALKYTVYKEIMKRFREHGSLGIQRKD